jgi:signal transduction histidine kinase
MLRSASFRMAGVYAGLFSLSAVVFMLFLWWSTAGLLERQVESAIQTDSQILSEHWLEGGLASLAINIRERLDQDVDEAAFYLLVDPAGNRLAGNVEHWPASITSTDRWYELPVSRGGTRELAEMRAFGLPGGDRLLIGRDIRGRDMLRRLLGQTLLYALLLVFVLSMLGVIVVRNLFHRMVSNVADTTSRIAAGELNERVKLIGTGDEFDQVAETINDMLDRIARLMDGVRQVSNSIAHDLRTPITRARGLLEDALAAERQPGELRSAIEHAVDNLDDITKVFEALLRISEIEAGSRRAAFATFDLAPLLATLGEFYAALAEEGGSTVEVDAPEHLELRGDRALLQQAIANLLDNAIKFSPPNGTVRLSASAGASGVVITVADDGPGMPPEDLMRATERFFRGETARSTPGSGLGLALVLAVVQLHGGDLRLEDAKPGLVARMLLPVRGV